MIRIVVRARSLRWLAALLALMVTSAAWALNTGDIAGIVKDSDGLEVPGVTLLLSSPDGVMGGDRTTVSADDGSFRFTDLMPGKYSITASKDKFRGTTVKDIQVFVGQSVRVDVALEYGSAEETVVVEDKRDTVDVDNVTRGEVLTKDFLQKIPAGRSYQSAVGMAAGVVNGNGGNPNMGGAASNENTYMLDGVNITDPVTGTFSLNFNYDAIQQIEVLLGGYEPEYGVSLGGIVNVVTESGTNNLKFNTAVYYMNGNWAPKLDARYSADGFQMAPTGFDSNFQLFQVAATISGPVVRDKAWFILSYESARSLISNVGIDLPRDYDGHYVFAKLTAQPNAEHRITASVQLNPTTIDNVDQGTITARPESQGRQAQGGTIGQLKWQWFLAPNANLDTSFVVQQQYLEVGGVPCTHDRKLGYNPCNPGEEENTVDWDTPGRIGINGAYDSVNWPYFQFDDRWRYSASTRLAVLSVKDPLKGSHDFKFGAEAIQTRWSNITGYTGNTLYYDLNDVAYNPRTFMNYYYTEVSGPWNFTTSGSQWNLFAQDAYKPLSNLTIKYGLRYDHTIQRNDVGDPVVVSGLLGPRAYAAWDPFGDNKTKIAGGYGRFNDTGRLSISDFTSLSSFGTKLVLGEYFGQFVNGNDAMYSIVPQTNPNLTNDNLRTPRVDEIILMLQRQIVEDVSIGGTGSYKMTRFLYEPDEVNMIYDQDGSASIGTRYGDPLRSIARLRTPQLARRDYWQGDLFLDKVQSHRWFGRLTYTYALSRGSSSSALSGSFMNDPQTQYNYGNLYATDLRHQVKAYAAWSLPTDPWVQTIGATVTYQSGFPFERYYYSDDAQGYGIRIRPRSVYGRLPGTWQAGFRFGQDIDVRKGKVTLSVDVLNLLNFQAPVDNNWYYIAAENRNFVVYRQDPLQMQLGARYSF